MSIINTIKATKRRHDLMADARAAHRQRCEHGDSGWCTIESKHGNCVDCGQFTSGRELRVEEVTLKRKYVILCQSCQLYPSPIIKRRQDELRALRTTADWERVSDPVAKASVIADRMPEQYDGAARKAVRAFVDAGFDVAAVPSVQAATLNSVIRTLGLERFAYAEVRGSETVLRRITPTTHKK